jgi:hypothetical protein
LITAFILFSAFIATSIYFSGWLNTWHSLQIPAMYPPYADLRTVQGALSSIEFGFDPQSNNPGDPWGRPMNYPYIWVSIGKIIGLNNNINFIITVTAYILCYIWCGYLYLKKYPYHSILLSLISGASLLAVERGNNDLVIYCLLYFSITSNSSLRKSIYLTIATILKIYPIVCIPLLFGKKKNLFFVTLLVSIYFLTNLKQFILIKRATPIGISMSYGAPSIAAIFQSHNSQISFMHGFKIQYIIIDIILSLSALTIWIKTLSSKNEIAITPINHEGHFLMAGALLYIFTFLFSSNFDYRLIFLIFCIPYLHLINNNTYKHLGIFLIITASNQFFMAKYLGNFGLALNILCKTTLFVYITVVLLDYLQTQYQKIILRSRSDPFRFKIIKMPLRIM